MVKRVSVPILLFLLCPCVSAQFRDRLGNPPVAVRLTHPPGLGIQAKRVAFGPTQGPCSDQLIDAVISDFVENKVEVIDRQNLNTMLAEHQFSLSGYVDQKSAAQLGKILGPSVLLFIKVQRCQTAQKALYDDRRTYDKNNPVVRVYISQTQAFLKGSIQAVDLETGRIFAAQTIDSNPSRQNESASGRPEFPPEPELQDQSLLEAASSIHRMFLPWIETRNLLFFDDNDCGLKRAFQLLKAGDLQGSLQLSEQNLKQCKSGPKTDRKALAHAYYNVGMGHFIRNDYDRALEYFSEAAELRPGDVVNEAVTMCKTAKDLMAQMQAVEQRMAVEAAQASAREEKKATQEAAKKPTALTVKDIVAMRQAGISEELIAAKIRKEGRAYDLGLDEMLELKRSGLSESLIKVMLDPTAEWKPPVKP